MNMQNNEKQLNDMLKSELRNELSSEEEDNVSTYQQGTSRNGYRKPIKNPFSEQSESQDSDLDNSQPQKNVSPFPPKIPKPKSVLQQAQQTMKWNRDEQNEIEILTKLQGQGMKDKKIRQIANKYKTLNIAYEKQKTLRKNMQTQLNNQLKINEDQRNKSIQKDKESTIKSNKSLMKEGKCQNPTCIQNQKKVMEMRLQSQNLKTELNKAHRVIARQIGQNFNIDQVLNQQNAWKGRQQKIEKLKGRVKQLQERLANNGVNVSHMSGFTQVSSATRNNNANNNLNMTRTSTMAENKRKEFDNLKVQVDALKSENDLLQGKIKSVTSRKLILQGQIKQIKAQYEKKKQILMEKSENDDKFINLLKAQNQKLKRQERVVTKVVYKDQKDNDQIVSLKRQIQKLRAQLTKSEVQRKSRQKQQKCLDNVDQNISTNEQKIQIKFPPSQKKRNSVQRPASKKCQVLGESEGQNGGGGQISSQKKKQLQNQYLKGNKYLKKLSAEQEISIYQNWKSGKKIQ